MELPKLKNSYRKPKKSIITRHLQQSPFYANDNAKCFTRPVSRYEKMAMGSQSKMDDSASQIVFYHKSDISHIKMKSKNSLKLGEKKYYRDFHPESESAYASFLGQSQNVSALGTRFDPESLADPYQKSNPLISHCKMTPTLYTMNASRIIEKNQSQISYTNLQDSADEMGILNIEN